MKKVKMLTVIPSNLAQELSEKKKIKDYNTLPQLNDWILSAVREYMIEKVGYPNLPMACLSSVHSKGDIDGEDILSILPANSKDSVIFQLEMPEDMIVSIGFSELLEISNESNDAADPMELEFLKERLYDALQLGFDETTVDQISFIPFLAFDRCSFYAKLDTNFQASDLHLTGLREMRVKELASFVN